MKVNKCDGHGKVYRYPCEVNVQESCNRSPDTKLMQQRRLGHPFECSFHEIGEEVERIFPVELAGSGHGENPLGEAFPVFGLVAKAEFSPLDCRPESLFGRVVGGFDSLMAEEGKQMRPVAKRSFGSGSYFPVRAAPVFEAVAFHPSPWQSRGVQELPAGDVAFAESMPATQYVPDFLEHVFGKHIGIRAASTFLEALELSDQMRPAKLPQSVLVVAAVG